MMRKWLILATLLLLFGSGMWLAFGEQEGKRYPADAVSAEIEKICKGTGFDFCKPSDLLAPSPIRRWLGIRERKEWKIWIFVDPRGGILSGFEVKMHHKGDEALSVEIFSESRFSKQADASEKDLRAEFPGLRCVISKP